MRNSKFSEESKLVLEIAWSNGFIRKDNYDFLAELTGTTRKDISVWLASRTYAAKRKSFPKPDTNSRTNGIVMELAYQNGMLKRGDRSNYDDLASILHKERKWVSTWIAARRFKAKRKNGGFTYQRKRKQTSYEIPRKRMRTTLQEERNSDSEISFLPPLLPSQLENPRKGNMQCTNSFVWQQRRWVTSLIAARRLQAKRKNVGRMVEMKRKLMAEQVRNKQLRTEIEFLPPLLPSELCYPSN